MNPTLGEVMTTIPVQVESSAPLFKVGELMRRYQVRHLPVIEGKKLVGVVSERDIRMFENSDPDQWLQRPVREIHTPAVFELPPDASVAEAVEGMLNRRIGSVVVVRDGEVRGIFTVTDALRILFDWYQDSHRETEED